MTRVLALDLATLTGWACGATEGTPVSHGVCAMPKTGEDLGRYLAHFRDWLNLAIDEMEPGEIIFESPILRGATTIATLRKLYSLAGVTELVARDRRILVTEAQIDTIRLHFIRTNRAPRDIKDAKVRRMWLKAKTIAECKARGFSCTDDNEADAIALLSLRLSQLSAGYSLKATPLFSGVAA